MAFDIFLLEVILSGLMTGVMYALVALGFVLIFKASGIFNFAQGVMALFAALALYDFLAEDGWFFAVFGFTLPVWLAIPATIVVMIVLAWVIERTVLRFLVKQNEIILFMATIGLAFVLEGLGDILFGSDVKPLDIGIPQGASDWLLDSFNLYLEKLEIFAAGTAAVLVVVLAIFFQRTRIGRALRAVADDHQAALSVGISLDKIWVIVWSVSGIVALVAGIMWGSKSGVQFSLSLIALKALTRADFGRIHIGSWRNRRRTHYRRGRKIGRGLYWPNGGWRYRELVCVHVGVGLSAVQTPRLIRRTHHREGLTMFYRESGQLKSSYPADQAMFPGYPGSLVCDRRTRCGLSGDTVVYQSVLGQRDPAAVPGLCACSPGFEYPHRLLWPSVARDRGLHGRRRLCLLQTGRFFPRT